MQTATIPVFLQYAELS